MKFTDGYWLLKKNVSANYPLLVYDYDLGEKSVSLMAATRDTTAHRGDTLNCPVLTYTFSSPLENVIRVRIEHFKGVKKLPPEFAVSDERRRLEVAQDSDRIVLASGGLSAVISKNEWQIDYLGEGRRITGSGSKGAGYMQVADDQGGGKNFCKEELSLGVGELIYGLGERFTHFVKNGQVVDIWNADGGTASEQAYKNIPFFISNRGYGVFVNHPGKVSFEVGSEKVSRTGFSVSGESLEYLIIYGPDAKAIVERYTALTGRPALPPAWSFGLWLTTSFLTDYDEKTVSGFIDGMKDRDIPLHVFHFDCFWMKGMRWCDFTWDSDFFPDPKGMLERLKRKGLKICLWINPYIAQRSPLFAEGAARGYLLKRPNGDVWQWNEWQAGMGIVDFTNPDASKWYCDYLRGLVDMGVDAFKTDFGEKIPTDVVYHNGADPEKMHNFYAFLYNQAVFKTLEEKAGRGQAVLFARSSTAGGQQFPVHWGGDCSGTYDSMAETLRGGLSLCSSGFAFWSHDIGGFDSRATPDVYKRWIPFGLLSSHSRLHGSKTYRVPWHYDEEAVDVLRHFVKLKCRLMPYIFQKAVEASKQGIPLVRPMFMEFPRDLSCETLDRQFMLGEALLVAPVMSEEGRVAYYLPQGTWTDVASGQPVEGGRWLQAAPGYQEVPLLARPGSAVPMGACDSRPDYEYANDVEINLYEPYDGMDLPVEVPGIDGEPSLALRISRRGKIITISPEGRGMPWKVKIHSADQEVASASQATTDGRTVIPDKPQNIVTLKIIPAGRHRDTGPVA